MPARLSGGGIEVLMLRWGQGYVLPGTTTVGYVDDENRVRAILYPPSLKIIPVPSRRPRKGQA